MKFRKRRKGQDGGQKTDEQQIDFQKGVMRNRDEKLEENLETIQTLLEDAAGKVAHSTKHERVNTGECEDT